MSPVLYLSLLACDPAAPLPAESGGVEAAPKVTACDPVTRTDSSEFGLLSVSRYEATNMKQAGSRSPRWT